jgi:PIN like domain
LKVFFDNCTSPVFAGSLNALIQPNGHEARHVRFMPEYGLAHDTADVDWITRLSTDPADWIVVTGDQRIRKNICRARCVDTRWTESIRARARISENAGQPVRVRTALAVAGNGKVHLARRARLDVRDVN